MAENAYLIEIHTDTRLSDWELDELRQMVVDYLSPEDHMTKVEINTLDS